jgi:hypothetical protein
MTTSLQLARCTLHETPLKVANDGCTVGIPSENAFCSCRTLSSLS